jgi:threonine/homoserine efflux transporter RhtA
MGLAVITATNVTIDGNVLAGIVERTTLDVDGTKLVDYGGGYSICALKQSGPCESIRVTNNIAAGVVYAGFITTGNDCGDTSGRQSGNVAHSVKGLLAGHGLFFREAEG